MANNPNKSIKNVQDQVWERKVVQFNLKRVKLCTTHLSVSFPTPYGLPVNHFSFIFFFFSAGFQPVVYEIIIPRCLTPSDGGGDLLHINSATVHVFLSNHGFECKRDDFWYCCMALI